MRALVLCGLAPVLFAFLPASAQEREAPPRLPEIRVIPPSAPGALPPSSTPSRVDTLTGPEIRRDAPAVLPEALERLPGVSLPSEQGNRLQPDLSLRGFTISPVTGLPPGLSVFLDGVRLNEPTVEEVNFDLIPLEDVERVDVVRGPSVLFGRNTLGGAINLVTRRGQEVREIVPEVAARSFGRRDYRLRPRGSARHRAVQRHPARAQQPPAQPDALDGWRGPGEPRRCLRGAEERPGRRGRVRAPRRPEPDLRGVLGGAAARGGPDRSSACRGGLVPGLDHTRPRPLHPGLHHGRHRGGTLGLPASRHRRPAGRSIERRPPVQPVQPSRRRQPEPERTAAPVPRLPPGVPGARIPRAPARRAGRRVPGAPGGRS